MVRRRNPARRGRTAAMLALVAGLVAGCGGQSSSATHSSIPTQSSTANTATLEQQFVDVVKRTRPQVVQIQTDAGLGSGVIYDASGDIVTNAHVLASATAVRVTLADGRQFPARLVGAYVPDDLAVISIGTGHGLTPARFADSAKVEVGDIVLAMGNPLGLQSSVTDGIVSATGRTVSEGQGVVLPSAIQTSAPINPGNSGGALVDLSGQVVGIPTLAAGNPQAGGTASGIGFAIPGNLVVDIAGQIVKYGKVVNSHRAALGANLADNLARAGAIVVSLQPGGPAEKAGLAVGDTIAAISGRTVASVDDLATAMADLRPGQSVGVAVIHPDGTRSTKTVVVGQLPGS